MVEIDIGNIGLNLRLETGICGDEIAPYRGRINLIECRIRWWEVG